MRTLTREQQEEQLELLKRKSAYEGLKKMPAAFRRQQDAVAAQIVNSRTPNWGSIRLTITKNGV